MEKLNAESLRYARPDWVDPDLYPFQDNWIIIDGNLVHYVDEGGKDHPVLLFVHPGPGWSFTYRQHIEELKDEFRCIALDFPGYGLSQAVAKGYKFTLREQGSVLNKFVQTLGLNHIIVWANDAGGPSSILGLAPLKDRVDRLVVGGTFGWSLKPYRTVSWTLWIATNIVSRFINRYSNILAWTIGHMALGTRKLSTNELQHYVQPFKERDSRNRVLRLFRSFLEKEMQGELDLALEMFHDKLVLIQFGENDPMTRQHWPERWARDIPQSKIDIIPRVKHFTFEDAPEITIANFRKWWRATIQVKPEVS